MQTNEPNLETPEAAGSAPPPISLAEPARLPAPVEPQNEGCNGTCAPGGIAEPPAFIYAIGKVQARFPSLSLEKEFAQAAGRENAAGKTDAETFHAVLSKRENRYLARQMCYVLTIEGLETYLLQPRDPGDLDLLIESIRPTPTPLDVDVVIGFKGPMAPPEMCNGLTVPIVFCDQMYSFDRDTLIKSVPKPEKAGAREFSNTTAETFDRIMQMADNAGATDEHRAMNYLAVRYPALYAKACECHHQNHSLTNIEVRPSRLGGLRRIYDVILSFNHRQTDVSEKYFVRVDVTEEFPFLVTKLSPFYDR